MWAMEPSYEEGDGRAIKETTLGSPKYCSGEKRKRERRGSDRWWKQCNVIRRIPFDIEFRTWSGTLSDETFDGAIWPFSSPFDSSWQPTND